MFLGYFRSNKLSGIVIREAREQARSGEQAYIFGLLYLVVRTCKMMANDVFTLEAAGNYFNKNFVCVKIDMEKGEGPAIGKQYEVDAYPTFFNY